MHPIVLKSYQQQAKQDVLVHIENGLHESLIRVLIVMATGLGKTLTVASILEKAIQIEAVIENGGGVLFLCHSMDILKHAEKEFRKLAIDGLTYGILNGGKKNFEFDVLFATFQMMANRKESFDPSEFMVVVVDESHHGQAPTYKEVIEYFTPKLLLGMTATPDREDEKDIRDIFGSEIVNISLAEGIANGWLANVRYQLITDNMDPNVFHQLVREVLEEGKRISINQINRTLFIRSKDEEVASRIASHGKKGIIFCESIEHAENFVTYLRDAETCHSRKSDSQNDAIMQSFVNGSTKFILVVDKFNEGIDIPDTEMIVFLRCTDSRRIFLQQLGRGLRNAEGKTEILVLDFAGNCERMLMVRELSRQIVEHYPKDKKRELIDEPICLEGEGFNILFDVKEFDVFRVLETLSQRKDYYPTWQEAGEAARKLGIIGQTEYNCRYKEDDRLPADLRFYPDFPGIREFLGTSFYATWQEAYVAIKKLGIKSRVDYKLRRKEDSRLPSCPDEIYSDFPGWSYLRFYTTWQEAGKAARSLGVRTSGDYSQLYQKDSRLPSYPPRFYSNFPSWADFLGRSERKYATYREASEAARKLKITGGRRGYLQRYKEDVRLVATPDRIYADFPGWKKFLGEE